MGSLAATGAAGLGTGAFTQSTAQREIELSIQPDSSGNAYLDFEPISEYAEYNERDMKLSFGDNGRGSGIPSRANTLFESVFAIKNQGTNPVEVLVPSYSEVSKSTVQNKPAAGSTEFLVNQSKSPVSDPEGVRLVGSNQITVDVDSVDISWPEGISPANKPSNPVPQDSSQSDSGDGRVDTTYTGLRYPGGTAALDPGERVEVDIRFNVSNNRANGPDDRSAGLLFRANSNAVTDDGWAV